MCVSVFMSLYSALDNFWLIVCFIKFIVVIMLMMVVVVVLLLLLLIMMMIIIIKLFVKRFAAAILMILLRAFMFKTGLTLLRVFFPMPVF